jgi:hypothetical protein
MYTTNTFIHEYLNHRNRDKMYTTNTFIHEYLNHSINKNSSENLQGYLSNMEIKYL